MSNRHPVVYRLIEKGEGASPQKSQRQVLPMTGKNPPRYQDMKEMRRQAKIPAPFFDKK